jgi:hypothetical protein
MSIFTTPLFYYDFTVTVDDIFINFNEGGPELTTTVSAGRYSFTDLASQIALALNNIGGQVYTVTANRADRTYTISASSNFSLLFETGSNSGLSVASVIGFDASDKTGANTYSSDSPAGKEFSPQFPLQDYVDLQDYQEFSQANINESASGKIEVFSIGTNRFLEFNIGPTTDNVMRSSGGLFVNNPSAVSELRQFMQYAITKGPIEFMKSNADKSTFNTIILERTPTSGTGTGFKLRELYGRGLVGFFETGNLRFRERV